MSGPDKKDNHASAKGVVEVTRYSVRGKTVKRFVVDSDYTTGDSKMEEPVSGGKLKKPYTWSEERSIAADARAANERWAAKPKARVTHPMWGSVIVPCSSPMAAIFCAAEVWEVDWAQIINAKVEACDQNLPAEPRPAKEEDKPEKKNDKNWMVIHPALGYVYVTAADVTEAIWAAAKHWGKDPRLAEFHQGCTVRARR